MLLASACSSTPAAVTRGNRSTSAISLGTPGADLDAADVDAASFTADYPCGFGFTAGTSDQTLALTIRWSGSDDLNGPDVSGSIELPSSEWTGEITSGSDLFGGWCNDMPFHRCVTASDLSGTRTMAN